MVPEVVLHGDRYGSLHCCCVFGATLPDCVCDTTLYSLGVVTIPYTLILFLTTETKYLACNLPNPVVAVGEPRDGGVANR
jgi:hypothetical protein